MLRIEELRVGYGPITALRGVTLEVRAGEFAALLGRNGAGKTTLLLAVMGALPLRGGRILFQGENITKLPPWERVRRGLSLVPEGRRIFAPLTVLENLELGAFTQSSRKWKDQLEQVLTLFPRLKERLGLPAGALSGGEQQMLAVARALMSQPKCLLLDEPSMGLAPKVAGLIFDSLARLKGELTVLVVEQNVSRVLQLADRIFILDSGHLKQEVTGKEIDLETIERAYFGE